MARYTVAFRVNDVVFTETLETEKEAFEQARAWFEARLPDVSVTVGETEYTFRDFATKIARVRSDAPRAKRHALDSRRPKPHGSCDNRWHHLRLDLELHVFGGGTEAADDVPQCLTVCLHAKRR